MAVTLGTANKTHQCYIRCWDFCLLGGCNLYTCRTCSCQISGFFPENFLNRLNFPTNKSLKVLKWEKCGCRSPRPNSRPSKTFRSDSKDVSVILAVGDDRFATWIIVFAAGNALLRQMLSSVTTYKPYSESMYRFAVKKKTSSKVSYTILLLSDSTFFKLFFSTYSPPLLRHLS